MPVTSTEPLAGDEPAANMSSADAALEMFGVNNDDEPPVFQQAIETFLDELADGKTKSKLGSTRGAMAFGSLWDNSLLVALRVESDEVVNHGDWKALGLVGTEQEVLALPHQLIKTLFSVTCDPSVVGPIARFNAIGEKRLPAAEQTMSIHDDQFDHSPSAQACCTRMLPGHTVRTV